MSMNSKWQKNNLSGVRNQFLGYGGRAWSGEHHSRAILVGEQHLPGFYPLTLANGQGRSKAVTIGAKQSHCRRKANSLRDLLRWLARDWYFQSPPNCRDRLEHGSICCPSANRTKRHSHHADRWRMPVFPRAPSRIARWSGHRVESGSRSALRPPARERVIEAVTGFHLVQFAVQAIRFQPPESAL